VDGCRAGAHRTVIVAHRPLMRSFAHGAKSCVMVSARVGTLARCHDCNVPLNQAGWIVTPNYPATETVVGMLDQVLICDLCMVARCRRGTAEEAPATSDPSVVPAVRARGIPRS
jgi:hypothetical protein